MVFTTWWYTWTMHLVAVYKTKVRMLHPRSCSHLTTNPPSERPGCRIVIWLLADKLIFINQVCAKKDSSSSSSSSSPLDCHLRIHRSNFKTPNVLHMAHLSWTFAVSALTDSGLSFTRRLSFNSNSLGFLVFPSSSLKKRENAPYCEQTGCFCGQPSLRLCLWRGADNKGPHAGSQQICFLSRPFFFVVVSVVFHFQNWSSSNSRCMKKERTQTPFQRDTGSVWHFFQYWDGAQTSRLEGFPGLSWDGGGSFVVHTHCLLSPSVSDLGFFPLLFWCSMTCRLKAQSLKKGSNF